MIKGNRPDQSTADLFVERVYKGGRKGNFSDDPLPSLIGVSNQGGFRYLGTVDSPNLIVLTTTMNDLDWPDSLDQETGVFTYYGDNKEPGSELHDTPRFGNRLLRDLFSNAHRAAAHRARVPPLLVFSNTGVWRDITFLGLAVPGAENLGPAEDLVGVWKIKGGERFQNYRAKFTILDVPQISRDWLKDIKGGSPLTENCPKAWKDWVSSGTYTALKATRSQEHRNRQEQLPEDSISSSMVQAIHGFFQDNPTGFEACASRIAQMMLANIASIDLTRPTRDGGRDAIGKYRIGSGASGILVDFALEAKCYAFDHSVGVREMSRLISRLRHRQFGVLVTTSYVASQAYQEIKDDGHPIIVISARDIAELLKGAGMSCRDDVENWLGRSF